MKLPSQNIESGFYYHYKHDPLKGIEHYAYYVLGIGINTEDDCGPRDANLVAYMPLYKDSPAKIWLRPVEMFLDNVTKEEKTFPRFSKIEDEGIKAELSKIKKDMYGE